MAYKYVCNRQPTSLTIRPSSTSILDSNGETLHSEEVQTVLPSINGAVVGQFPRSRSWDCAKRRGTRA